MDEQLLKVRVLNAFIDTRTKRQYAADDIIEMTEPRFIEATRNLDKKGGNFLQLMEDGEDEGDGEDNDVAAEAATPRAGELAAVIEALGIKKPLPQMKTEELEAVAKELGIDLSAAVNNPDRAAAIAAWLPESIDA